MLRVSEQTRRRVMRVGKEDYGGASADETVQRLLDEHWRAAAVAAVRQFRDDDPQGWARYISDADAASETDAEVVDGWDK